MKNKLHFIHLFSILFLLAAFTEVMWPRFILPLDAQLSDFLVRIHAKELKVDPQIVIVNIDDISLAKMDKKVGKMPWPRSVHAEVLEAIYRQAPKAIVFDITFSEKDRDRPESDLLFNQSLLGKSNVFLPIVRQSLDKDGYVGQLQEIAPALGLIKTDHADLSAQGSFLLPFAIERNSWRVGSINFSQDLDGVGRRYELYTDVSGWLVPSLPARVMSDLYYFVPNQADMLLSWRGGRQPYHRISYVDLYEDLERENPLRDQNEFKDKIVLIGADASSMHDMRVTPIDSLYSGIDILATALDNIKNQKAMTMPPRWLMLLATFIVLVLIYLCFVWRVHAFFPGIGLVVLTAMSLLLSYFALSQLILVHILAPLLFAWAYYFSLALHAYRIELQSRRQTEQEFGRFVNPHVVKEIISGKGISRAGESREITVMFSDIRGFTNLSENRTPQEVVELLNRYFSLQVAVIFRHDGSLDKFMGDCIMAFWGAPLDDPKHAEKAVKAALEMAVVLQQFKSELGSIDIDFDVGIGIHSGPAVVGLIGSEQRKEFTAIGDTVNLASRIEGLTKGVSRILVSRETMSLCSDILDFEAFGSYKVKGREHEVELFAPTLRKA